MTEFDQMTAKVAEALDTAAQCASSEAAKDYGVLAEQLEAIGTSAGQCMRSHLEYKPLLAKLQRGAELDPDDMKTLRSLIVGDADQYLKYDDDFEQSKTELGRVLDQIRQLQSRVPDLETLMRLRVLCREATSALVPTVHYLEQKERVRNFEEHTRGPLDAEARRALAGIVAHIAD
jgi:hypothetical protein